jgi:phosphopantetheinyl transferase (holo-ACP synthase)
VLKVDLYYMRSNVCSFSVAFRRIEKLADFFRLMRRQFTELEWETVERAGTEADQLATFYR